MSDPWSELAARYDKSPSPALEREVLDAAREIMKRVRKNAEILVKNLEDMGYEIGGGTSEVDERDDKPVGDPISPEEIDSLAENRGPFPLALRAFWEVVGHLNFVGLPPVDMSNEWPELEQLDALQIYSLGDDLTMDEQIVVALDPVLKAGYGGVGPIYTLPKDSADAALFFEDAALDELAGAFPGHLVGYLREAFVRGGFYGLSPKTHRDLIARLRKGMIDV